MQGYFTGGLYIFLGSIGIFFAGKDYFINNNLHALDSYLSIAVFFIGVGFSFHTYVSIKKIGKENFKEIRGCFLPGTKK